MTMGKKMMELAAQDPNVEGLPLVYTNWLRAIPSPFDFALDFGYMVPLPEPPAEPPTPTIRVVMTWEYAKLLRNALNEMIEQREGNRGEIMLPPGLVENAVRAGDGDEDE